MKKGITFIFLFFFFYLLTGCNTLKIQKCNPIFCMDTTIDITFYNTKDYQKHYKAIKEIYYKYDEISSDFNSSGKSVKDLNDNRFINDADIELIALIKEANSIMQTTNGFFNLYMGRLTHLWKDAISKNEVLSDDTINNELVIINNTSIVIDEATNDIRLNGEGNLDLGGIAKGYATQKAYEYLTNNNITSYLINAGNSNVLLGNKNGDSFKVGLTKPYENGNIIIYEGINKAIGTSSGKYQNFILNGIRYHHLINPLTGYPSNTYDNVNVLCEDSMLADAYSTAIFAMDLDTAIEFAKNNEIEIILYKDDSILYRSEGWK